MDNTDKVPVILDGKCVFCSLQIVSVKGGKQVLYLADDGTIVKREPLHRYKERQKRRATAGRAAEHTVVPRAASSDDYLLMCKNTPVYNITRGDVLCKELLPGAMLRETMDYSAWMRTRYSVGSNASARRLMLRAFGTDNHARTLDATRALSLSDCYWLKKQSENICFDKLTPYKNAEWQGIGEFTGGSISTLFVNGAADKRWLNAQSLLKVNSFKEFDAYVLCEKLGLGSFAAKAELSSDGIVVQNFTSVDYFFESFEQSGYAGQTDDARCAAVEMFGEQAVSLFTVDYLCEHDDRHWGNFGFLRNTGNGEYISMAPYFDFDWAWSDGTIALPGNAVIKHAKHIRALCEQALSVSEGLNYADVVKKRAGELLQSVSGGLAAF